MLLLGCQGDWVDVSRLDDRDRALFRVAAARENVNVTTRGEAWDWTVEYFRDPARDGHAVRSYKLGVQVDCAMYVDRANMDTCGTGGTDHHFVVVARHELNHCKGYRGHSSDPTSLMYKISPCYPID